MNKGLLYGAGAYAIWGLLPLYWRALGALPPLEILSHRIVWALLVTIGLVALRRGGWAWLGEAARTPRTMLTFALSSLLLSANWWIYIWAVNNGHVVETSLSLWRTRSGPTVTYAALPDGTLIDVVSFRTRGGAPDVYAPIPTWRSCGMCCTSMRATP